MKITGEHVILLISPEPWDAHTVSKHHYAMELADAGYKVLFLDPPVKNSREMEIEPLEAYHGISIVKAPAVATALRFYPPQLRRWRERRWLERLEQQTGYKVSIVWLFENSRFFDMGFADKCLKIYHQVDLNQGFQLKTAAKTADICFCTTDFIKQKLESFNPHVYKIHHGASMTGAVPELPPTMAERFTLGRLHAGYIGNLDIPYLDVPLLVELTEAFPSVDFHFVGTYRQGGVLHRACAAAPNAIWWGRVDSVLIPSILQQCDILLVTYLAEAFKEQLASPHKVMEYLASGKTVVATYTDEYKDKRHLLEMVDDSVDFKAAFERVVNHLDEYNSPARSTERKRFAEAHSYTSQLRKIFCAITDSCFSGHEL